MALGGAGIGVFDCGPEFAGFECRGRGFRSSFGRRTSGHWYPPSDVARGRRCGGTGELIQEIQASSLLYADETSWPQQDQDGLLWLWTFITTRVTYYTIAGRGKPTVLRVLAGFTG